MVSLAGNLIELNTQAIKYLPICLCKAMFPRLHLPGVPSSWVWIELSNSQGSYIWGKEGKGKWNQQLHPPLSPLSLLLPLLPVPSPSHFLPLLPSIFRLPQCELLFSSMPSPSCQEPLERQAQRNISLLRLFYFGIFSHGDEKKVNRGSHLTAYSKLT